MGDGLTFTAPTFYDGQGLLVRRWVGSGLRNSSNQSSSTTRVGISGQESMGLPGEITRAADLNSNQSIICALEERLDYQEQIRLHLPLAHIRLFEYLNVAVAALYDGECTAVSDSKTLLAYVGMSGGDESQLMGTILPETWSRRPLGLVARAGDAEWGRVVRYVVNSLLLGEEINVTQEVALEAASDPSSSAVQALTAAQKEILGEEESLC